VTIGDTLRAIATIALLVVAVDRPAMACEACGGAAGATFERIRARHPPGHIIVLLSPESRLRELNQGTRLARMLERNGHELRVVESDTDLQQALDRSPADLILADENDAGKLRQGIASRGALPPVLSIGIGAPRDSIAQSAQADCTVLNSSRSERDLVRAIESLLARSQSGTIEKCERPGIAAL
jgi:hypothetical protein